MNSNLHRLAYCSRNLIKGNDLEVVAELKQILAISRRNNTRVGVTGALLYNSGTFAQVLEGPLASIEQIFEAIQRDPRHSEVTVVECGTAAERDFPEWSMAFTGKPAVDKTATAVAAVDAVFAEMAGAGEQMMAVLRDLVVREEDWILLDAA